ncbi:MAG: UDP-3-O-[3-hydroxymyristoyl] N-acetylglucosamine deacetylase [Planctomycetes bacterium]|nr:UDP-3-O-[3-hydroxymyristoyl] N-acetylglucosamine deacetylase [Planctomycetota bacterium]
MKKNQQTIKHPVEIEGVGLFSGAPVRLRLRPAPANTGIVFVRTDLPNAPRLPVNPDTAVSKFRRSSVSNDAGVEVETIEHLLSALGGLEVDNIEIDVSAPELPNPDGCSRAFVELVRKGEIVELPEARKVYVVREPVAVTENDVSIVALPSEQQLTLSYTMNYGGTPLGRQHLTVEMSEQTYEREIAPARTFCLESEAQALMQQGLGKGANTQNTVVVGPAGPIDTELKWPDEPVRHKILDLMGDLTTLGGYLRAHVVAVKSGHGTNIKLVKKIAQIFESGEGAHRTETLLDVREITKILPHRFPFLLIDKVIEMDGYRRAVGIKNVTYNEPFFQGHFPGEPIMPGVLQIEAMAQLAGVLLMRKSDNQAKIAVMLALDGVKLRKSVVPGDQLRIEVETLKVKSRTGEVYGRVTVDGALVAEANMKFMLMDQP